MNMDVSENSGTPKSSILIGFSILNHPFWGTPNIFPNGLVQTTVCYGEDPGNSSSPTLRPPSSIIGGLKLLQPHFARRSPWGEKLRLEIPLGGLDASLVGFLNLRGR